MTLQHLLLIRSVFVVLYYQVLLNYHSRRYRQNNKYEHQNCGNPEVFFHECHPYLQCSFCMLSSQCITITGRDQEGS